jgi:carbon storage regulator
MLVLSRRLNEAVVIGDGVLVRVIRIRSGHVRLAIDAPAQVSVDREEVRERKLRDGPLDVGVLACRPPWEDRAITNGTGDRRVPTVARF